MLAAFPMGPMCPQRRENTMYAIFCHDCNQESDSITKACAYCGSTDVEAEELDCMSRSEIITEALEWLEPVVEGLNHNKTNCGSCGLAHYENWEEYQLRQKLEGAQQKLQQALKYLHSNKLDAKVETA